jgi:hypothetical protein
MFFDGKKFTNNGSPKSFSFPMAWKMARGLVRKFPILGNYKVWVRQVAGRRNNPESLDVEHAAKKFEDFTGHPAKTLIETNIPSVRTGLVIGELDLIGYRVKRDGIAGGKLAQYTHQFRKKSRPLLAVSKDGNQLLIVGGRYEFTEAGIEDR